MFDDATIWKLVDGELPPEQAREIETAAAGNEELARRIEECRYLKQSVLAGAPRPPVDFPDRVAARVAERVARPAIDLDEARRFLRRMLVAAAVLAALGLAYLAIELVPALLPPTEVYANPLLGGK